MNTGNHTLGGSRGLPDGPFLDEDALWRMDDEPGTVLTALRHRYGDMFTIHRENAPPRVVLTTDQHIGELVRRDPQLHSCGTSQFAELVGEHSVNMLSGQAHRRMRQLLLPPIHGRALHSRAPHLRRIIRDEFDRLSRTPPVPLIEFTRDIALHIATSTLFSSTPHAQEDDICAVLVDLVDGVHRYRAVPPACRSVEWKTAVRTRFTEQRTQLDRQLSTLIAERRAHPPEAAPVDVLGVLLAAPEALSDRQIRDQLVTMLVAGHLTTASSLAMAAYWMNQPGDHADDVLAELVTLPEDASATDLAALRHLAAFCDETLRIGSVIPHSSGRRTAAPLTAFGHHLPVGTELIVSIHLVHRRPEVFPEPETFDPRRFVDRPPSATEFIPFGLGTRRCPGAALVALEMKTFLAEMHRTPDLELIGADIPFRTVSLGSTLAPPPHLLIRRTGRRCGQGGER